MLCILYKSTACHIWPGVPSCYLKLLDKLQKQICKTVGPSLAACLEPLAHRRNVASISLFYKYLETFNLNWLDWFNFLILEGGLLVILIDCMIFLSSFLDLTSMSMSAVFFIIELDTGTAFL